jgi:hypothetical protein
MDVVLRPYKMNKESHISIIKKAGMWMALIPVILLFSCEKNTLETTSVGAPSLYFTANFDGAPVSYKVGEQTFMANSYHYTNNHDSFLTYSFTIEDLKNPSKKHLEITINNYRIPYTNISKDIDFTIIPGMYKYSSSMPRPGNPWRLSEVSINWYNDLQEAYSSYNTDQKNGIFMITEVKDTFFDGSSGKILLKKVSIDFKCKLIFRPKADTIDVTKGKMVAIFYK